MVNDIFYKLANQTVNLMNKPTTKGEALLIRIKTIFERWNSEPITDENLKSIYQDIENILEEAKEAEQ